jgi:hypothetical protein
MMINALRLSVVVTETILDLQRGTGANMPLASFVSEPGYIATVDTVQRGDTAPLELRVPWPYRAGHHFWDAYLNDKLPGDANGKLCFEKLVPLRLPKLAEKMEIALPDFAATAARLTIEGLYYPHGTGLLATAAVEGELDLAATGRIAQALRRDKVYKSPWPARAAGPLTLDQLMTAALDQLRELGFGTGMAGVRSTPFSIATVLRGEGVDPNAPLAPDGEIHRLLNGLAGWVRDWQKRPAPPLVAGTTQLQLKRETAFPGNVLFAAKRGRAVWFPGQFLPATPPPHGLGCYHRNLGFASLQVESLLMLAVASEAAFAQGALVPAAIQQLGQLAAGLLARLYSGTKSYRSDSQRAQIIQSAQLADVNALRQRFGMSPIP